MGKHAYQNDNVEKLIKEIAKKEATVKKATTQINDDRKQINHIKRSRTWKIGKPFSKIKHFFIKIFGLETEKQQADYIKQMEAYTTSLEDELADVKKQLKHSLLDDRQIISQQIIHEMRELKDSGDLIGYIEQAAQQKRTHMNNYNEALIYAARLFMNEHPEQRNLVYSKIFSVLHADEIPEFMIRAGLSDDELPLKDVASFRGSLSRRVRQKQFTHSLPEYTLESKLDAYKFADQLNIRRPHITEGQFTAHDIPKQAMTVIKPVDGAGSRGVYLIYALDDIIDIKRARKYTSILELEESMQKDLTLGWVEEDRWMAEELILENVEEQLPASDIKFYSFYGKVGLILEITRYPERKHCWWTATGERIRTGKYEEDLFKGKGVSQEELHVAEQISSKIPAPFVRIDFLRSEKGLVFGEFTAKPGNYDEFDDLTDKWLGDYYLDAEARLGNDLLEKKEFAEYNKFIDAQPKIVQQQS